MADIISTSVHSTAPRPRSSEEDPLTEHEAQLRADLKYWQQHSERVRELCAKAAQIRNAPVPNGRAAELEAARAAVTEKQLAMTLEERCDYFEAHLHPGAWRESAEIVVAATLLIDRTHAMLDLFD